MPSLPSQSRRDSAAEHSSPGSRLAEGCARVWVTADDFGLGPRVNREIVALAERGALSAVSVMVHRDACLEALGELRSLPIRIGLHATFTGGVALVPEIGRMPRAWWSLAPRTLIDSRLARLITELRSQAERLADLVGRIDFVNAHEHVHLLPRLWPAVVDLVVERRIAALRMPGWPPAGRSGPEDALACVAALARVRAPLPKGVVATEPLGVLRAGGLDEPRIRALLTRERALASMPARTLELCCHPATPSGTTPEADLLASGAIDRIVASLGLVREGAS